MERVSLREAWLSEANDFTPWLATDENIELLSEAIGIALVVEAQEKDVGPFRADILCKSLDDDSWVLIENQLERTDHAHLGQLITYAAGLDAVTIVWVAQRFTDEHRAALDWLNQITDRRINFFGVEIELWRIGSSPYAPKFNVVSKPNDWSKTVGEARNGVATGPLKPAQQLQLEYWRAFRAYLDRTGTFLRGGGPLPRSSMGFAIGRRGFSLRAVATTYDAVTEKYGPGRIRAQINIEGPEAPRQFEILQARRTELEAEVGEPLSWVGSEGFRRRRILVQREADLSDRTKWPEQHAWLLEKLEALHRTFAPAIRSLEDASAVVMRDE